ncbi:MAG TPA: triose-phosphate isomerase family protein [Actinomycetales bacterium]|nr:triose-phosphate isomerase family protein [Actinomycetales bacterium]
MQKADTPPAANRAVIAMNFKMYFDHRQAVAWCEAARDIITDLGTLRDGHADFVVFPSFPSIPAVLDIFAGTGVHVGAQNMSSFASGAYTGEVSAVSLAQLGCTYIEIGHAERRNLFGETEEDIRNKMSLAYENGLTPLLCVGEPEPTSPNLAAQQCIEFIERAVGGVAASEARPAVIAYEPQWAIGAAQAADLGYIKEVSTRLSGWLESHEKLSGSSVIYGGSAGPGLYTELDGKVSGVFLGRRAHDPEALRTVLEETAQLKRD